MKKEYSDVAKGISMILQIGVNMIVSVALSLFIGYKLDKWFATKYWMLIFLVLGFAAGIRSVYMITKGFYADNLKRENEEQQYFADLYEERKKNEALRGNDSHE